jgi:hypothetical protein
VFISKYAAININTAITRIPFSSDHAFVFLIHTNIWYRRKEIIIISAISVHLIPDTRDRYVSTSSNPRAI